MYLKAILNFNLYKTENKRHIDFGKSINISNATSFDIIFLILKCSETYIYDIFNFILLL